jgi:hypothetical protein
MTTRELYSTEGYRVCLINADGDAGTRLLTIVRLDDEATGVVDQFHHIRQIADALDTLADFESKGADMQPMIEPVESWLGTWVDKYRTT